MNITDHKDHEWEFRKPCVYCKDCNIRLYQGKLPKDQEGKESVGKALDSLIKAARLQNSSSID